MPDTDYKSLNQYVIDTLRKDREAFSAGQPAPIAAPGASAGIMGYLKTYLPDSELPAAGTTAQRTEEIVCWNNVD